MAKYQSHPSGSFSYELGEGPVWNPITKRVSTVDIFARQVHIYELSSNSLVEVDGFDCTGDVGAALPTAHGEFLLCQNDGIFLRGADGKQQLICELPVKGSEFRSNDAMLGPDGNLWLGVMDYEASEGVGSLWRINRRGESQCLLDGLTIPNGLDWWQGEFWFVDGPASQIRKYHWDERGLVPTPNKFLTNGTPDGLVIDSSGEIWLALWGQGRVDHFNRAGEVIDSVSVDSPHSTSLCFAGDLLDTLVMTSAKFAMTEQQLAEYERAGDHFLAQLPVRGRLPNMDFN